MFLSKTSRFTRAAATLTSALAVTAMLSAGAAPAYAQSGDRYIGGFSKKDDGTENQRRSAFHDRRGSYNTYAARHNGRNWRHRRHRNNDDALVGGLIGLGAGLIIGNAISNSGPAYAPPPRYAPTYAPDYAPPAWSDDWYAYCASKYRSFNPRTGTYTTYGGEQRLCR